jgi:hypothetical protein
VAGASALVAGLALIPRLRHLRNVRPATTAP